MLIPPRSRVLAVSLALVLLAAGCLGVVADDPSRETIETRLEQGPTADTVTGTYTITETVDGGTERTEVRVWKVAGERVRQEITSSNRSNRVVVANESRTWVYFPERGEAYRRGFTVLDQTGVQAYSYAALIGNLDAYRIEYRGRETVADRATHHVELVARGPGDSLPELEFYTYRIGADPGGATMRPTHVELWLDTEYWYPLKHELRVADGGEAGSTYTTTITYGTVTFDEPIDPTRFDFDPERDATEVVMDDVATVYRPFDRVAGAEARAGVVYGVPETVDRYRLERVAVVESAAGRGIKGLYVPAGSGASDAETRITRPTHPAAVTVTVSPDGTYRELTGLPPIDGEHRTVAGIDVTFARLEGRWIEATFACRGHHYTVVGNEAVDVDTMRQFLNATTCP